MNRGIWILRGAVALVAVSAFVAIWGGWVGLGRLAGFGPVDLLPGVPGGPYEVDLSITLPLGVEAFAAIALYVAVSGLVEGGARTFAWVAAIGSLGLGMFGQAAYHLLTAQEHGAGATPTWVVVFVSVLPVLVLGLASLLLHLAEAARQTSVRSEDGEQEQVFDGGPDGPGNGSGNGEQEPVEPWLDDVEFARLVAGIDVPAIEEHGNENAGNAGGEHVLGPGNNAENNPGNSVPGGGEQVGNAPGNNTVPGTENTAENNPGNGVPQAGNEPVPPAATSENTTGEHAENSVPGTGNTAGEHVPVAAGNTVSGAGNVVGERDPRRVLHPVPALENTAGERAGNAGTRAREHAGEHGNTAPGTREHGSGNNPGNGPGNVAGDSLTDEEHAQELARRIAAGEQVDLTIRGIKTACRVGAKRAGNIRALVEEYTEAVIAA